jgi:hypothetical protein
VLIVFLNVQNIWYLIRMNYVRLRKQIEKLNEEVHGILK